MKVSDLIEKLKEFDGELEVTITDGFDGVFYSGAYDVTLFNDGEKKVVDIGIGGCKEE